MARRIEPKCEIPGDCVPEKTVNCALVEGWLVVLDMKKDARVVFKDTEGEYVAQFWPNVGWVWGE